MDNRPRVVKMAKVLDRPMRGAVDVRIYLDDSMPIEIDPGMELITVAILPGVTER